MENTMIQATTPEDSIEDMLTEWAMSLKVRIQIEVITKATAEKWLGLSGGNRKLNSGRVTSYGAAMQNAEFKLSNDLICFDENGKLVNGHHRLEACAKTGVPFVAIVAYNMPSDSVYDRGFVRTLGNSLYMSKSVSEEMTSTYAIAIARRYLEIKTGKSSAFDFEIRDFLNANDENISKAIELCNGGTKKAKLTRKAPIQAAILAALQSGVDENTLADFTKAVNTGYMTDSKQSAAILLRNKMIGMTTYTGRTPPNELCAFAQLAIRDFVNGTPRKVIYRKLSFPYIPDAKIKLD